MKKFTIAFAVLLLSCFGVSAQNSIQHSDIEQGAKKIELVAEKILAFRQRNSRYPKEGNEWIMDMLNHPEQYGFKDASAVFSELADEDSKDQPVLQSSTINAYITGYRPDGSPIDSPKKPGQSDVIAYTDLYAVKNPIITPKGMSYNYSGDFLIVRDSGKVERVPQDLSLWYTSDGTNYRDSFPFQAGTPFDTVSFEEKNTFLSPIVSSQFYPVTSLPMKLHENNGGLESLIQLSRRMDYPSSYGLERENIWQQFTPSQTEFTLANIEVGATKLGLNTQVEKQTLAQLQKSGTPALLFLQDDGRIITLTGIDDDRAVVIDRGMTQNVERSVLEKRYSGEALVPTKALTQNAAIVADDAVREVKLPSLDAEVPQQFTLRNTGATPLTLQLEYPLLGVTESKLSKDTIAPGETATLDLKVKWRSILKAPYQNVLVSIQTNDPIVPRLQLAILLTPPLTPPQGAAQ